MSSIKGNSGTETLQSRYSNLFKRIRTADGRKQCNIRSKHDSSFTARVRSCHLVSNSGQNAVCLPPSLSPLCPPHAACRIRSLARSPSKQHLQALLTEYGTEYGTAHTRVTPHFIPLDRTQSWKEKRPSHEEGGKSCAKNGTFFFKCCL